MRFTEVGQDAKHDCPNTDEESDNEEQNLPLRNRDGPQEAPVTTIRSAEPVVTKDLGTKEPQNDLPAEQGLEEVRNLGRRLTVVI